MWRARDDLETEHAVPAASDCMKAVPELVAAKYLNYPEWSMACRNHAMSRYTAARTPPSLPLC